MAYFEVIVEGTGTAEIAAFGVADAEHGVEKEIGALLPAARVSIAAVERSSDSARIVENFSVTFRIRLAVPVEAEDAQGAASAAFRTLRASLAGSRYDRTRWEIGQ